MPDRKEIGLTLQQETDLDHIHEIAKAMEMEKNTGKTHALVALLEELSGKYIDIIYFVEKANILFEPDKIRIEWVEEK